MIDKLEEKQQMTNRIIRLERCFKIIEKKIFALEEVYEKLFEYMKETSNAQNR